ncbi:ester cyclase [Microbacterium sp. No. 7]|uniref:ester cyclase n=1 Tax=Microbacterium sp. No. 7 TaxID=1714373 RepID=UPI0006D1A883|nr:ester cyclase [Microbacterium sp. No. 7]
MTDSESERAKAVVRRNTIEAQSGGDFDVFDELFVDDFNDHTPQPGTEPTKEGVRFLCTVLREAFLDFRTEVGWQVVEGDTPYRHGECQGPRACNRRREGDAPSP